MDKLKSELVQLLDELEEISQDYLDASEASQFKSDLLAQRTGLIRAQAKLELVLERNGIKTRGRLFEHESD